MSRHAQLGDRLFFKTQEVIKIGIVVALGEGDRLGQRLLAAGKGLFFDVGVQ